MQKIMMQFSKSNTFFTSDTHFGHANIIKLCGRPFKDVEEMNETLIKNWNNVVEKDSHVFHLGDFAFGGSALFNSICPRLNGTIHLILGNHDFKNFREGYSKYFADITQQMYIQIDGKSIYLNHNPFLCFGGAWRGKEAVWQLFGHVHSSPTQATGLDIQRLVNLFPTQYDVGVDNNNYTPVSFQQVKKIIDTQQESLGLWNKNQ